MSSDQGTTPRLSQSQHAIGTTITALEGLTMDFVTDLPDLTASEYTGIVVMVDQLTKMAIYLPCRTDIESPKRVRVHFEHGLCKHGVPDNIFTDRGRNSPVHPGLECVHISALITNYLPHFTL